MGKWQANSYGRMVTRGRVSSYGRTSMYMYNIYSAVHPQIHTRAQVQLALDTSAVASVTQISIYGIAADNYVSFKLSIVNVFVPALLHSILLRVCHSRVVRARV